MRIEIVLSLALTALLAGCAGDGTATAPPPAAKEKPAAPGRLVFAHYMVCFAAYGESVRDYKREIAEAQAAGIDGFVLNVGAWSKEPYYQHRTAMLYQAAVELGTDFRLFFSVDLGDVPDILDMIGTYAEHPNQFRHNDRVVVSTFSHDSVPWREAVIAPLKQRGIEIFFVPYFYPRPQVTELPDFPTVAAHVRQYGDLVDGMFYFGAAGLPQQLAAANTAYARAMRQAGKLCMASYTPHYWGARQPDRRYFESEGGSGTEIQWRAIIAARPAWVEIVTWNDFNESSWVSPCPDPGRCNPGLRLPERPSHAGYLELSRHFIAWYKTGQEPRVARDSAFWFYRTHPKDAVPTTADDPPVTAFHGDVRDVIYLTTLFTAPTEVRVCSGNGAVSYQGRIGLHHTTIPFAPGPQRFELLRNGRVLAEERGPDIEAQPKVRNFFPASGVITVDPLRL